MGRPHREVAVIKAFDASSELAEEIIPLENFRIGGSIYLNSPHVRVARGIRMISLRLFDANGQRLSANLYYYARDGSRVDALYRRPDGSIIDTVIPESPIQ